MLSEQELKQLVAETLQVSPDQVTWDADLLADLHADSLVLAELAAALENRTGHSVPADEFVDVATVGDLRDLLNQAN